MKNKLLKSDLAFLQLALFFTLIFLPILKAGFYSDDMWNSLLGSYELLYKDRSLFSWLLHIESDNLHHTGRFNFSYLVLGTFHHVFDNAASYQLARVILIFLSVMSFSWLITLLTKKKENGLLLAFLIPSLWLVQIFFDSLVSFDATYALDTIFIALTCCFLVKARDAKNRRLFLCLSLICYVGAIFTYEIGSVLVLALVISLIAYETNKESSFFLTRIAHAFFSKKFLPYLIITSIWISVTLFFRLTAPSGGNYDGWIFGNIMLIPLTFFTQLATTFPLASLSDQGYTIGYDDVICVIILFFVAFFSIYKFLPKLNLGKKQNGLFLIGLSLLFLPALIISFSNKYQQFALTNPHNAHLQIYYQYVGLTILMLFLCDKIINDFLSRGGLKKTFTILMSLGFAVLISCVNYSNYEVVYLRNIGEGYNQRAVIEEALSDGIYSQNELEQHHKTQPRLNILPQLIEAEIWLDNQVRNGDKLFPTSSNKAEAEEAMRNYPAIISSAHQLYSPIIFAQKSHLVANLVRVARFSGPLLESEVKQSLFKKIPDESRLFLLESGHNLRSGGYVVAGNIVGIKYIVLDSVVKILGYQISNPRIFFSHQYFAKLDHMKKELNQRFKNKQVAEALKKITADSLSKNSITINLPSGIYIFNDTFAGDVDG